MSHENGGWMNSDQRGYYENLARQKERKDSARLLAVDKPLSEMNTAELSEHWSNLTSPELYDAATTPEIGVQFGKLNVVAGTLVWAMAVRLRFPG
jgi:hypothetical protein